jgi:hypothetical protein
MLLVEPASPGTPRGPWRAPPHLGRGLQLITRRLSLGHLDSAQRLGPNGTALAMGLLVMGVFHDGATGSCAMAASRRADLLPSAPVLRQEVRLNAGWLDRARQRGHVVGAR